MAKKKRKRPKMQETSLEANRRIEQQKPTGRAIVLRAIIDAGKYGRTDEEIQEETGLKVQTETARRNDLARDKLIVDSERRRPTSSGRPAIVWVEARWGPRAEDKQASLF